MPAEAELSQYCDTLGKNRVISSNALGGAQSLFII